MPFVSRTRAIFRNAELGFFGVIVRTWRHTPRFCGLPLRPDLDLLFRELYESRRAGVRDLTRSGFRGFLISWLIVGI
jgi:hypothetical protein